MSNFINMLLKRVYWAMVITWVVVVGVGICKADAHWTVTFLQSLAPTALGLVGVAAAHWIVLYRRELKNEAN
jgi:FtsH-binding integral membrane protein